MTDEGQEQEQGGNETEELDEPGNPPVPTHVQDWFLADLVELAEMGIEQHITLTVGGAHINGNLIGGRRYFELLVEAMEEGHNLGEKDVLDAITNMYRANQDVYAKPGEERPPMGTKPPTYIHLRDARWFEANGKTFPGNGLMWRGRISAVEGFALGQIQTVKGG